MSRSRKWMEMKRQEGQQLLIWILLHEMIMFTPAAQLPEAARSLRSPMPPRQTWHSTKTGSAWNRENFDEKNNFQCSVSFSVHSASFSKFYLSLAWTWIPLSNSLAFLALIVIYWVCKDCCICMIMYAHVSSALTEISGVQRGRVTVSPCTHCIDEPRDSHDSRNSRD